MRTNNQILELILGMSDGDRLNAVGVAREVEGTLSDRLDHGITEAMGWAEGS